MLEQVEKEVSCHQLKYSQGLKIIRPQIRAEPRGDVRAGEPHHGPGHRAERQRESRPGRGSHARCLRLIDSRRR